MTTPIGINGFGRIGRQTLKAIPDRHADELQVVGINDLALYRRHSNAHLFKYDLDRRPLRRRGQRRRRREIVVDGHHIRASSEKILLTGPGRCSGVDIVIESTGLFTDATRAGRHEDGAEGDHQRARQERGRHHRARRQHNKYDPASTT